MKFDRFLCQHSMGSLSQRFRLKPWVALLAACFGTAQANPLGPEVVFGQASFVKQGNILSITNSPNAIINWQSFSINASEATRFIQQSADSAVLNRILGQNPTQILGALQSNGRVFLINPNGIVFGRGAQVNVNGLVASSLHIADNDFLAGRLNFSGPSTAGGVSNQGAITTPDGGRVFLIAPNVDNSGIITSAKGEVVLAAGHTVQLVDSTNPDLHVVVSAPENQALNLGRIMARGGRIGIFGGLVSQRGSVGASADSAVLGENGKIVFKASGAARLGIGSQTSAENISIQAGGDIAIDGAILGSAGGTLELRSAGGNIGQSAPVTAAALLALAEGGAVALNHQDNRIATVAGRAAGAFQLHSGIGLRLGSVKGVSGIRAGGVGDALVLATEGGFDNASGSATPLLAPAGRWLVYSATPEGNNKGGMAGDFTRYSCALGKGCSTDGTSIPAAGNGFVYSIAPSLSVTPDASSSRYGSNLGPVSYSLSGFIGDETDAKSAGVGGKASFVSEVNNFSPVGRYGVAYGGGLASSLGYRIIPAVGLKPTHTVNGAVITISVDVVGEPSKTYDGNTDATLNAANYSLFGFVNGEGASVTKTTGSYDSADAGWRTVTVTLGDGDYQAGGTTDLANYVLPGSASGAGKIIQADLVLMPAGDTKVYDGSTASGAAVSASGLVRGDSLATAIQRFESKDVAGPNRSTLLVQSYQIMNDNGNDTTANYIVSPGTATGTITPAPLVVTAKDANKTYDGQSWSGGSGVTFEGFVGRESPANLTGALTFGGDAQGASHAGLYKIAPFGLASVNYEIQFASGGLTIDRAPLSLALPSAANPLRKTYDGTTDAALGVGDYILSGFVGGESAVLTKTAASYDHHNVGARTVTVDLSEDDYRPNAVTRLSNYILPATASGFGVIDPAALALIAVSDTKVYDAGVLSGAAVEVRGLAASDHAHALQVFDSKDVLGAGRSTLLVQDGYRIVDGNGNDASANYTIGTRKAGGTITPALLSVSANDDKKTFDGKPYGGGNGVTFSGFVGGESGTVLAGTLAYGGTAQNAVNAGIYSITPGGLSAANYEITFVDGVLNIDQAILRAVTAAITGNPSKTYDGTAEATLASADFTLEGFVGSDGASVTKTSGSYASANAGTHTVTVALADGDFLAHGETRLSNYSLPDSASGPGTIARAPLSLSAVADTKVYDGTTASGAAVEIKGHAATDTVNAVQVFDSQDVLGDNRSTLLVKPDFSIVNGDKQDMSANYIIDSAKAQGTITPAALSVVALDDKKTFDGKPYAGGNGVRFHGLVNGESAAVLGGALTYGGTAQGALNVGSYAIEPGGLTSGNYKIAFVDGVLGIDPAILSVIAASVTGNPSKTYDGNAEATLSGADYTLSGFVGTDDARVTKTSGSYDSANAGDRTVKVELDAGDFAPLGATLLSNYSLPSVASGPGTIHRAPLALNALADGKVYDGTAASGQAVEVKGMVGGDTIKVEQVFASKNVLGPQRSTLLVQPDYAIVNADNLDMSGNYAIETNTAGGTISPAALTIVANNYAKAYDGKPYQGGNGVSYLGFVGDEGADALSGLLSYGGTAQGAVNASSYAIRPAGLTSENYAISYIDGVLTINPALLTIVAASVTGNPKKTYDGGDSATLSSGDYTLSGFVGGDSALVTQTHGHYDSANAGSRVVTVDLSSADFAPGTGTNLQNYLLPPLASGPGVIAPAPLSVNAANAAKTYDGKAYAGGNGVTINGFVNGEGLANLGGALSYGGSAQGALHAGQYSITPGGLNSGNYAIRYADGTLTLGRATLASANIIGNPGKTYDGNNNALLTSANFQLSGFVGGEGASVTKTSAGYDSVNAGQRKLGTTLANSDFSANTGTLLTDYVLPSSASGSGVINPAALTVSARDFSKTFDGKPFAGGNGVTYQGFVNNEASGVLSGILAYGGSAQGAVNVGAYQITPGGLSSGNYAITFVDGKLSIDARALQVIAASIGGNPRKTYDGTTSATLVATDYLLSGFAVGDGAKVTKTSGSYDSADAGQRTVSVTLAATDFAPATGTLLGNYKLPGSASGVGTIVPALLSVSANNDGKTYDGKPYAGGNGVVYKGFVNNEGSAVLKGSLLYGGSAQGALNVGTYKITPGGLSSGNYNLVFVDGVLKIDRAGLSAVSVGLVGNPGKTYDGGNLAILNSDNYLLSGFVGGDGASITKTSGVYDSANAGSRTVTVNLQDSDFLGRGATLLSNYTLPSVAKGGGTISPASLTVRANADGKTYDGKPYAGGNGVGYKGFVGNEDSSVLGGALGYAGSAQGALNAGKYAIVPGGLTSSNYNIAFVDDVLTINPAALTLAGLGGNPGKTYDGGTAATLGSANFILNGLQGNDAVTVTKTSGSYDSANAGSRTVTVSLSAADFQAQGGTLLSNYTLPGAASGSGSINRAPLDIVANDDGKTFDGKAYSGGKGVSYSGFVNNETSAVLGGTLSFGGSAQGAVNGGSYAISPGGLTSDNYLLAFVDGKLTVVQATLKVTASIAGNPSKVYDGGTLATLTSANYVLAGFVGDDAAKVGKTSGSYDSANAGSRTVTVNLSAGDFVALGGTLLSNYLLPSVASGAGTISKATLTLTPVGDTKVYDGGVASNAPVKVTGNVAGDKVTVAEVFGAKNVLGANASTLSIKPGYTVTNAAQRDVSANYDINDRASAPGTINKAPLLVKAPSVVKPFDDNTSASGTATVTGLVAGDAASAATLAFANKDGGSKKTVLASGVTVKDAANADMSGNYAISYVADTASEITLPKLADCAKPPRALGCAQVLPTPGQCTASPTTAGCELILPPTQTASAEPLGQAVNNTVKLINTVTNTPTTMPVVSVQPPAQMPPPGSVPPPPGSVPPPPAAAQTPPAGSVPPPPPSALSPPPAPDQERSSGSGSIQLAAAPPPPPPPPQDGGSAARPDSGGSPPPPPPQDGGSAARPDSGGSPPPPPPGGDKPPAGADKAPGKPDEAKKDEPKKEEPKKEEKKDDKKDNKKDEVKESDAKRNEAPPRKLSCN